MRLLAKQGGPMRRTVSSLSLTTLTCVALAASGQPTAAYPTSPSQPARHRPAATAGASSDSEHALSALGSLPIRFEPNVGQTDGEVDFLARSANATIFLTAREAVLVVGGHGSGIGDRSETGLRARASGGFEEPAANPSTLAPDLQPSASVLRLQPVGANPHARVTGLELLPGTTNYFIGDDPSKWRTNVPSYTRVKYEGVYPGIDLVFYGNGGDLEYDFVCAPGADPSRIGLAVEGADRVEIDAVGELVMHTAAGTVRQQAPRIYQEAGGGRRDVAGGYVLRRDGTVGFELASYDTSQVLVVDPQLVYATYLGGSGFDAANGMAVDAAGAVYVTGYTRSPEFPIENGLPGMTRPDEFNVSAFVTKLSPEGTLVYSTFLGGSGTIGKEIAVDATGAAYVVGDTTSRDFPTRNPIQATLRGFQNVFLAKLGVDGSSILFSTFLGGSNEEALDVVVDEQGYAFVVGITRASNNEFPLVNARQTTYGGGESDGFLSIIDPSSPRLVLSSYFGGDEFDNASTCVLDPETGDVYVGGTTYSSDFIAEGSSSRKGGPVVEHKDEWLAGLKAEAPRAYQYAYNEVQELKRRDPNSYADCKIRMKWWRHAANKFFIRVGSDLRKIRSKGQDTGVDMTFSLLDLDLRVAKEATFGGHGFDDTTGLALDARGAAYVVGYTDSTDLPTTNALQPAYAGGRYDAYVTVFAPESDRVVFATYLGGSGDDRALGIDVNAQGNIYVVGITDSTDFPTSGALQPAPQGRSDAFVAKISAVSFEPDFGLSVDPASLTVTKGQSGQIAVNVDRLGGFAGRVTVAAPNTRAIKVKLTPAEASTTGESVTFTYKVKKKAQPGTHELVFTGRDAEGRERTASLTLVIQ
jgi:hypothetical protein